MAGDLNFSVKVNFNKSEADLVRILTEHIPEIDIDWHESSFFEGNQIELEEHKLRLYDTSTPEWWSYKFEIHFYAIGETNLDVQVNLANTIVGKLKSLNIDSYLVAAFADN